MARKSDAEVAVIVDRNFTYPLDASRSRTLPRGWQGEIPEAVAADLVESGHGRLKDGKGAKASDA